MVSVLLYFLKHCIQNSDFDIEWYLYSRDVTNFNILFTGGDPVVQYQIAE